MPEAIALSVDGRPVTVPAESMVSTAVLVSGAKWFRSQSRESAVGRSAAWGSVLNAG